MQHKAVAMFMLNLKSCTVTALCEMARFQITITMDMGQPKPSYLISGSLEKEFSKKVETVPMSQNSAETRECSPSMI